MYNIIYVFKAFVLHIIIINKFLDGNVLYNTPLYLKVFRFFTGIIFMVIMLDYRPGSGPPRPPTRRLGRPNTGDTINIPFGGCSSCAR
ncbi:hypothetical protein WN51_03016 [Melipona quadrifasciata]|uniref:Selenoprotein K n=1 Tax=Melipona quadrifasciata TaxID=166423 RepID=A0A0N0U4B3_9HYME|nr:hypothetical protein WN51_03016 [Melipona quadrifasciata]